MNFAKKLEEASDEELMNWVNMHSPIYTTLASDELTRRYISKLNKSIETNTLQAKKFSDSTNKFNEETSNQTEKVVRMTRTIKLLTWILVVGLIVQLWLTIK